MRDDQYDNRLNCYWRFYDLGADAVVVPDGVTREQALAEWNNKGRCSKMFILIAGSNNCDVIKHVAELNNWWRDTRGMGSRVDGDGTSELDEMECEERIKQIAVVIEREHDNLSDIGVALGDVFLSMSQARVRLRKLLNRIEQKEVGDDVQ